MQNFEHRHLWSVTETEVEKGPGGSGLTYHDDDSTEVPLQVDDDSMEVSCKEECEGTGNVCSLMLQQLKASRKEERW